VGGSPSIGNLEISPASMAFIKRRGTEAVNPPASGVEGVAVIVVKPREVKL